MVSVPQLLVSLTIILTNMPAIVNYVMFCSGCHFVMILAMFLSDISAALPEILLLLSCL